MRSFLINKNLCFHYWLRKRIGKKRALGVANTIEKMILISGREVMPHRAFYEKKIFRLTNATILDMEISKGGS